MSDATTEKMEQAYDLIRQERLDEAVAVLSPVLIADPTNADAWWLLANAVTEPEDAREALQKVLEFDPQHAQARDFLEQLNELHPPVPEAAASAFEFGESADFDALLGDTTTQPPPSAPPVGLPEVAPPEAEEREGVAPAMDLGTLFGEEPEVEAIGEIDEFEEALDFEAELEEPLFDAEEEAVERPRRRPVLRTLLVMLVVLVAALALVVLIAVSRPTAPAPATQPTSVPTLVVSDTVQVALDAAQQTANQQSQLLGGPATARLETSSLGTTLMIRVCRPAGTDLSQAMMIAMEMAANSGVSVRNELDAVGADLVNCDRDDTLMSAVAPVEQAMAFAADRSISSDEFRAGWQWQP